MAAGLKKIRTPIGQRLSDLRRGPFPVIVWVAALLGVLVLAERRTQTLWVTGIVETVEYEVSTVLAGVVDTLHVELYEDVEAGRIVASLKPDAVEAEIATALAEIERLRVAVAAERDTVAYALEQQARAEVLEGRRFNNDVENLSLQLAELQVNIESDQIELSRLEFQRQRARDLVERAIGPEADVEDYRLRAERVRSIIENNEILAARTDATLADARARRESFESTEPLASDGQVAVLREAVRVQELRVEEIRFARRALVLRAPVSGRVTGVLARPGQALLPGEPVARMVGLRPSELIAYLPEHAGLEVAEGDFVRIARPTAPLAQAEAAVRRIGPGIELLPERLWRDPAVAEYGRPVLIVGATGLEALPGETLKVYLDH